MEQQPWARSKLREELEEIKIGTEGVLWDEEKEEIASTYTMNWGGKVVLRQEISYLYSNYFRELKSKAVNKDPLDDSEYLMSTLICCSNFAWGNPAQNKYRVYYLHA